MTSTATTRHRFFCGHYPSTILTCVLTLSFFCLTGWAQTGNENEADNDLLQSVPDTVEVGAVTDDEQITARLTRILAATEWFQNTTVRTDAGVVFLEGVAGNEEQREWAGRLAANTRDVVAVVNRIEVREHSMWDITPAWNTLREMVTSALRLSPLLAVGLLLLVLTWLLARAVMRASGMVFRRRLRSPLLGDVAARIVAVPVFLLGLYLVLKISGLTGLAFTVIGGTGLIGLIIGFAFRDIAENFLASVLLSLQRPFVTGDLIEIQGYKGFVQSVNTRSTLLMTLEGNHVQIPNATIYKQTITNFTANPLERFEFTVGIGYDDEISSAQAIGSDVLRQHPAVVKDPEPLVLVETLGAATVNLRLYFWVDISIYSGLKVRSAVIRLVKHAFDEAGVSMPDEAREVVFPKGVPVQMVADGSETVAPALKPAGSPAARVEVTASAQIGEGELTSEAPDIREQARRARLPEGGKNLLES